MAQARPIFCPTSARLARAIARAVPRPAAVVGIGNALRGDDGFGPAVVAALRGEAGLTLFDVQAVPESFLVPIVRCGCAGIVFVDAADLGAAAGRVALVPPECVAEVAVSTHAVSLALVAEAIARLAEDEGRRVRCALLAAQPAGLDAADRLSPAAQRAVVLAAEGIRLFARASPAGADC
ncbi:MAG: hydrogenase maturation protease [Planctomycetes bacterium]|nr:hydrogenase maturation protease [Planctomycetota bacterium]